MTDQRVREELVRPVTAPIVSSMLLMEMGILNPSHERDVDFAQIPGVSNGTCLKPVRELWLAD